MTNNDNRAGPRLWNDKQLLFTIEEAASALHVGRTTVYALIKDGQLRAVHIGRSRRLTRAELLRYVTRLDQPVSHAGQSLASTHCGRRRTSANQAHRFDMSPMPPDAA